MGQQRIYKVPKSSSVNRRMEGRGHPAAALIRLIFVKLSAMRYGTGPSEMLMRRMLKPMLGAQAIVS